MFNYAFDQQPSTLLGNGTNKRKKKRPLKEQGASVSVTSMDPKRAQVDLDVEEIDTMVSTAEQKKKRRQRQTKGNNPFVRGATVLG